MQYSTATAPRWANAAHTAINLTVTFLVGDPPAAPAEGEEAPEGTRPEMVVPFTAMADDATEHGRSLFERAAAGDFGAVAAHAVAVVVPASVTMRQARLALLAAGKLAGVATAIVALPSPKKEAAQIEWEYAATVERASTLTELLAASLSLTEAQVDALFIEAATR